LQYCSSALKRGTALAVPLLFGYKKWAKHLPLHTEPFDDPIPRPFRGRLNASRVQTSFRGRAGFALISDKHFMEPQPSDLSSRAQPTRLWQVKGGMNQRSELHFLTHLQTNLSSRPPRLAVGPERSVVEGSAVHLFPKRRPRKLANPAQAFCSLGAQPTCLRQVERGMNEESVCSSSPSPKQICHPACPSLRGTDRSEVEGPAVPSASSCCQPERYPPLCHPDRSVDGPSAHPK
jgi:hypothetical protein